MCIADASLFIFLLELYTFMCMYGCYFAGHAFVLVMCLACSSNNRSLMTYIYITHCLEESW